MHRIGIVGVSYRHASAERVAQYAVQKGCIGARLLELRAALQGAEVLYLSTCNRVEIVYAVREGVAVDRRPEIFRTLTGREPLNGEALSGLRAWTGEAAVEHLLMVACGLDSAQAGEQEIFAQLRAAWQAAREAQVTGPLLDRILGEAMNMARHAHRLATHDAPSLADLAVERVMQHLSRKSGLSPPPGPKPGVESAPTVVSAQLSGPGPTAIPARIPGPAPATSGPQSGPAIVALVGVSPMTRRCGLRLRERGVPLLILNRSLEPALELAREIGATALSLDEFRQDPQPDCAALICASGATDPVIDRPLLMKLAASRPLLIDFGLPPNVEVDAARMLGFTRVGIDELVRTAREGRVAHLLRLAPVRAAIDEHLARLRSELAARAIGPQLAQLRDDFERITAEEVERLMRDILQHLDEAQRAGLAGWARTLAHRLAHLPLSGLRAAAEHAPPEATEAFFREARLRRSAASGATE